MLAPYETYGGLGINWRCLGSNGQKQRPAGGVLGTYMKCFPPDHENNRCVFHLGLDPWQCSALACLQPVPLQSP